MDYSKYEHQEINMEEVHVYRPKKPEESKPEPVKGKGKKKKSSADILERF